MDRLACVADEVDKGELLLMTMFSVVFETMSISLINVRELNWICSSLFSVCC